MSFDKHVKDFASKAVKDKHFNKAVGKSMKENPVATGAVAGAMVGASLGGPIGAVVGGAAGSAFGFFKKVSK